MVKALLGKIEGLFQKDFLFAAFLPALIFMGSTTAILVWVVGLKATWEWLDGWTATQKATYSAISSVSIVVFAYVLSGLRTVFLRLWSGMIGWPLKPFFQLLEELNRSSYVRLRRRAYRASKWDGLAEWFRNQVDLYYDVTKPPIPAEQHEELMELIDEFHEAMSVAIVKEHLSDRVIGAYRLFSGETLTDVHEKFRRRLEEWDKQERNNIANDRAKLDRQFATLESIRATDLGNLVEAYSAYPFKRYQIEGEVFWTRLQHVIKPDFLALIREFRILLDFCLAMATLFGFLSVLCLVGGPWLWSNAKFWVVATVLAFIVSYIFYRVGVFIAGELGDLVRSSFDLFRLDLLHSLYREHPATLLAERQIWEQLSQLVVFGDVQDFAIRPRQA